MAGMGQAERVAAREAERTRREKRAGEVVRREDQVDLESVEMLNAVRNLKGNEEEETGGDREKKGGGRLDVEA